MPQLEEIGIDEMSELFDRLAAIYNRRRMAMLVGKRYQTLDNEIKHRELGTANAKLGLMTALRMLQVALSPQSPPAAVEAAFEAIDWMVGRYGMVAFQVPRVNPNNPHAPLLQFAAALAKEFGESVTALGTALSDGRLTRAEIRRCQDEVRDVVRVCAELKAHLRVMEARKN